MPGEAIVLGPFTGGVTTRVSDLAALQEEDLVQADNYIYDIYGNLVTRPPIVEDTNQPTNANGEEWEVVLSGFFSTTNEPEVTPFIVITTKGSTQVRFGNGTWTEIATGYYPTAVQGSKGNQQVIWFARGLNNTEYETRQGSSLDGGWWDPTQSSIQTLAEIPGGNAAVWYKERVFFFNTGDEEKASRVQYSEIAPDAVAGDFPAANEFYVNINDGQSIQDAIVFLDNIFVFKYNSTYIVTYDTAIDRLQIKSISDTVGVLNRHCIQLYADTLYVFHNRFVWRFTGSQFVPLSQKIIVGSNATTSMEELLIGRDPSLSVWADCLLLRFGTTAFVYNFYTDAWTTWSSDLMFNYLVKYAENSDYSEFTYYGGLLRQTVRPLPPENTALIKIRTVWPLLEDENLQLDATNSEEFKARLVTKQYHFDQPASFKRLFWWGVNAVVDYRNKILLPTDLLTSAKDWIAYSGYATPQTIAVDPGNGIKVTINDGPSSNARTALIATTADKMLATIPGKKYRITLFVNGGASNCRWRVRIVGQESYSDWQIKGLINNVSLEFVATSYTTGYGIELEAPGSLPTGEPAWVFPGTITIADVSAAQVDSSLTALKGGFLALDEHTKNPRTWTDLVIPDVVTTRTQTQFFKFLKGLRFRLAAFYVEMLCDGGTPNSVNTIVAVVKGAQTVVGTNKSQTTGATSSSPLKASIGRIGRL